MGLLRYFVEPYVEIDQKSVQSIGVQQVVLQAAGQEVSAARPLRHAHPRPRLHSSGLRWLEPLAKGGGPRLQALLGGLDALPP